MSDAPATGPATGLWRLDRWRRHVLSQIAPLEPFELALLDAHGVVAADAVTVARPVPAHPASTTEGFAVRAEDASDEAVLGIIGASRGGRPGDAPVRPGQAVRVTAGAVMPEDTDAVLPAGHADDRGDHLVVRTPATPEAFVRPAGAELAEGAELVPAGAQLGPNELALLAAGGHARVRVHPQPRVAVLSAGEEICDPATRPQPGQVPDASGVMLAAMAREASARGLRHRPVSGDAGALGDAIEGALVQADLLVATGSVTVAEPETVYTALTGLGDVERVRVAMEPGGTQVFGVVEPEAGRPVPVFGLPGQPAAAAVSFEVFVRPAIRRLQGRRDLNRPRIVARLAAPVTGRADRVVFARVSLRRDDSGWVATPAEPAGSGVRSTLAAVHGLAEVPAGAERLAAGEQALIHLLVDPG